MKRNRINGAALAVIIMLSLGGAKAEPAPANSASGFTLTAFDTGYPGTTLEYDRTYARRLALELLPAIADQVTHAAVQEKVTLPGGSYLGLDFTFYLEPRIQRQTICEQPVIAIAMRYTADDWRSQTLQLDVRKGTVADHVFDDIRSGGRYRDLPTTLTTPQELRDACRKLTGELTGWKHAHNADDFAGQKWRQQALISALDALPRNKIKCNGTDGEPCRQSIGELRSYFRDKPARHSVSQFVPDEGEVNIFDYGDNDLDRDVTMWLEKGEPRRISIRLRKLNRPVI